jgi:hypothetical protein
VCTSSWSGEPRRSGEDGLVLNTGARSSNGNEKETQGGGERVVMKIVDTLWQDLFRWSKEVKRERLSFQTGGLALHHSADTLEPQLGSRFRDYK